MSIKEDMDTGFILFLFVLVVFFIASQGEGRSASEHTQTQEDRNEAMRLFKEDFVKSVQQCHRRHRSDSKLTWVMLQTQVNYRPGKCFLHCLITKYDMVDKNGEMKAEVIRRSVEKIPNGKSKILFEENMDSCVDTAAEFKSDICEQAYQLSQCLYSRVYKH